MLIAGTVTSSAFIAFPLIAGNASFGLAFLLGEIYKEEI